jgi:antitoxin (DNA-binding transcriptional repressor) of toxin-antitoxin stability system
VRLVEKKEATGTLAEYAASIQNGPVVVTDQGCPVAALVPVENADLETVSLSTNQQFIDLINRSRTRARIEGGVSSREMRRRVIQSPRKVPNKAVNRSRRQRES